MGSSFSVPTISLSPRAKRVITLSPTTCRLGELPPLSYPWLPGREALLDLLDRRHRVRPDAAQAERSDEICVATSGDGRDRTIGGFEEEGGGEDVASAGEVDRPHWIAR